MAIEQVDAVFRVYGDTMLECEHFVEWLKARKLSQLEFIEEIGFVDRPVFIFSDLKMNDKFYTFQLCPYYGGAGAQILWPNNPLNGEENEIT